MDLKRINQFHFKKKSMFHSYHFALTVYLALHASLSLVPASLMGGASGVVGVRRDFGILLPQC